MVNGVELPLNNGSKVKYLASKTLQVDSILIDGGGLDANAPTTIRFNSNTSLSSVNKILIEGI